MIAAFIRYDLNDSKVINVFIKASHTLGNHWKENSQ
jgi:hypothetical protein